MSVGYIMGTDEVTLKQVLPFLDKVVEKDSISYEWIFFLLIILYHIFLLCQAIAMAQPKLNKNDSFTKKKQYKSFLYWSAII